MEVIKLPQLQLYPDALTIVCYAAESGNYQFRLSNLTGTDTWAVICKVSPYPKNENPAKLDWVKLWHTKHKKRYHNHVKPRLQ